jgi:hypothetical protein
VNDALIPAVVAAGGGSAMLGAIVTYERVRDRRMRASRQSYWLVFPRGTDPKDATAALRTLTGVGFTYEVVSEVVADEAGIHHLLHLPERVASTILDQLTASLPGLRADPAAGRTTGAVTSGWRIVVPVRALLRTEDAAQASRALLAGLTALRAGERVSLRWALRPSGSAPMPTETGQRPTSLKTKAELQAWRARAGEQGFAVAGLLLIRTTNAARARQLSDHVIAALRSRRGLSRGLMVRRARIRSGAVMPGTGRTRGWLSAPELLPLLAWPIGQGPVQGVHMGATRRLPAARALPREGRRLLIGRDAYGERPVALSAEPARHHLVTLGPSGVGKSVLLCRAILDDLANGYGGVVIDPKADLVADLLDRVPIEHAERVVVLDPAAGGAVPGLELLSVGDPDLRSDVVLGALATIFHDSWGVRTDTYLRLGLRTLSELPHPVLTDWLRLFTDTSFREAAVARLSDPLLIAAWQSYEALSPAEQAQHVAAPMSKVVSLLARPAVRSVLAQPHPTLDIARLLAQRKWLVVSLSPGRLGEPAARLLAAILTYAVWTAIEARAATPAAERRPVFLYLDELQSLATLPFGLEYLFERARGLGCGVTVATQALARLPETIRQALLGNVGSLVSFRLAYDEATRVARELPGLTVEDLQALGRFEVAARIGKGAGSDVTVVTGRTEPLPPPTGQASRIRQLSAERYGGDPGEIDEELRRHHPAADVDKPALKRTRRPS